MSGSELKSEKEVRIGTRTLGSAAELIRLMK
jgi:hypothetical protein